MADDILLETSLAKNHKSFFHFSFVFDNNLWIANKNLIATIHILINVFNTESELSSMDFDFETLLYCFIQMQHKPHKYCNVTFSLAMPIVV